MIIKEEFADIATPTGPMRLHLFRPAATGRYPGILLYSEIYQITGPIRRMAASLAGQGYVAGAPRSITSTSRSAPCWPTTCPAPTVATTSNSPRKPRPSTAMREDGARPIIFYDRRATCWQPQVKNFTIMVNSIFNGARMEDVWLDKYESGQP